MRAAGEGQVLDIVRQGMADAGLDRVGALACVLAHLVGGVVDDVGVAAGAALHGVGAGAAVQPVVAGVAVQLVIAGVAIQEVVAIAADQRVVARAGVDDVIAGQAVQQIGAGIAVDDVGEHVAGAVDVGAASQGQVLDVVGQRVGDARLHQVGAFAARFGDNVAIVIDHVNVVAQAACHGVGAHAAVERVVAGVAGQLVVAGLAVQCVGAVAAKDHVVAVPRVNGIRPGLGTDRIAGAISGDDVVQGIAGADQALGAGQGQVFGVCSQRVVDVRLDRVDAGIQGFGDDVAGVVDHVGIVAEPALHVVRAGAAIQRVIARIGNQRVVAVEPAQHIDAAVAGDDVVERVAGTVDVRAARERQVLDVVGQGVADAGLDRVGAFALVLDHQVACVVDNIGVVAGAALQGIGAGTAVQHVVAAVALQLVVARIAVQHVVALAAGQRVIAGAGVDGVVAGHPVQHVGAGIAVDEVVEHVAAAVDVGAAGQGQVLDVVGQRVSDACLRQVGARVELFGDDVAVVIDHIGVVARAAVHLVGPQAAVQRVVAGFAKQLIIAQFSMQDVVAVTAVGEVVAGAGKDRVRARPRIDGIVAGIANDDVVQGVTGAVEVPGSAQGQVLDVVGERVANAGLYCVSARIERFDGDVAVLVDDIGVVADTAMQRVGAKATVESVVAAVADQGVIAIQAVHHIVGVVASERVVQIIAAAIDAAATCQGQVLDVVRQGVTGAGLNEVTSLAGVFDDHIRSVVHYIHIVARTAVQCVRAAPAVKDVVAFEAEQDIGCHVAVDGVVERVASAVVAGSAGQRQVFDILGQRVADTRLHAIGAGVEALGDHVACGVDHVRVVAGAAFHLVGAGPAVERVIAGLAVQRVVAGVAVEDIVAIAAVSDVAAGPAVDRVGARASAQRVVRAVAREDVVERIAGAVEFLGAGQGQVLDVIAQGVADA